MSVVVKKGAELSRRIHSTRLSACLPVLPS